MTACIDALAITKRSINASFVPTACSAPLCQASTILMKCVGTATMRGGCPADNSCLQDQGTSRVSLLMILPHDAQKSLFRQDLKSASGLEDSIYASQATVAQTDRK